MTITCRKPADLVAAAIGVLGFVPKESLVMLTFGGGPRFHARIDLDENHHQVCEALLAPVRRHGVTHVAFIVFTDDDTCIDLAGQLLARLVADFRAHGVDISAPSMTVTGETIHHADGTTERYDWRSSPAVAALVADGRRIEPDRDALKERVRATSNALIDGPEGVAALLIDLLDPEKRDRHLLALSTGDARTQVDHWLDITRRAHGLHAAAPSALAGLAAWLSGDGALAWVCADHALEANPGNRLAHILSDLLTQCVDPAIWDDLRRDLQ